MNSDLIQILKHPVWINHNVGDLYTMDNRADEYWKIVYYPILTDNKTKELYEEPRVLIEKPIKDGIDFREVPLRYLTKILKT